MFGWFKIGMMNFWVCLSAFPSYFIKDWNPMDYEMINKTILPYDGVWTPDTYLYNSESLEQRRTEALMNVIIETGYWRNDSRGACMQIF
jgi:nicotinic acetylcholine receptor